ncbi:MAG: OmpA family protein [Pseudomonadota bacterium]
MIAVVSQVRAGSGPFLPFIALMALMCSSAQAMPPSGGLAHEAFQSQLTGSVVKLVRYRRAASQSNDNAEALFDEGQYEFDSRDYRAAQRVFERLIDEYPNSDYALKAQRYLANIYKTLEPGRRSVRKVVRPTIEAQPLPHVSRPPAPSPDRARPDRTRMLSRAPITPRSIQPDAAMQRKLLLNIGDRVFFAADSNQIGAKARTVLRRQARWLRKNPGLKVRIEGHSHDNGGHEDDLVLSLRRAEQVRDRLIEEGVPADKISVFGRGRASPVAICDSAMCAAQNRRVVTLVYRADRATPYRQRVSLPQPRR